MSIKAKCPWYTAGCFSFHATTIKQRFEYKCLMKNKYENSWLNKKLFYTHRNVPVIFHANAIRSFKVMVYDLGPPVMLSKRTLYFS